MVKKKITKKEIDRIYDEMERKGEIKIRPENIGTPEFRKEFSKRIKELDEDG